jgi:hypothetical protein
MNEFFITFTNIVFLYKTNKKHLNYKQEKKRNPYLKMYFIKNSSKK